MRVTVVLFLLAFASCALSNKKKEAFSFGEIKEIYYQKWSAGVQEGGNGIDFYVVFKNPLEPDVQLASLVFQNYEGAFKKVSETVYAAKINSRQNDFILDENTVSEYGNKVPNKINLKTDEALLYFLIASKGKYVARLVKNTKEKPMIAYPTMERPKN